VKKPSGDIKKLIQEALDADDHAQAQALMAQLRKAKGDTD
jgi:hypothetical protein